MAISRMQNPQQLQGIGSLRQPYGLGKLVKKAFKGVKKIVKSPIGKAALLGGLGMYGMGAGPFAGGGIKGSGFLRGMMGARNMMGQGPLHGVSGSGSGGGIMGFAKKWLNPFNTKNPLLYSGGKFSGKKAFGLGAGAMIAAPFIQQALGAGPYRDDEEVEDDWTVTPGSISNIVSMAKNQDPSLRFLVNPDYVKSGFYAADGGRVGLLNGGEAGEAQMEQMLRAEYLKYRNQGGTMPYEQFKILVMKQAQQGQMPNQMMAADGGRAGYQGGELVEQQTDLIEGPGGGEEFQETVVEGQEQPSREQLEALAMEIFNLPVDELDEEQLLVVYQEAMQGQPMEEAVQEDEIQYAANGGRMGFKWGGSDAIDVAPLETYNIDEIQDIEKEIGVGPLAEDEVDEETQSMIIDMHGKGMDIETISTITQTPVEIINSVISALTQQSQGGRIGAQEGGLMDLGGQEKDYRDEGGFVALGGEERADDVPARLSKNEFVFTADAVRAAGGGDIDQGAEVMQNMMDNLEQGGEISEESQGLEGGEEIMSEEIIDESNPAQGMYDNYEQLQSRVG